LQAGQPGLTTVSVLSQREKRWKALIWSAGQVYAVVAMTSNWVDRRALRESQLAKASELWGDVITAIRECCESFNKYFPHLGSTLVNPPRSGPEDSQLQVQIKSPSTPTNPPGGTRFIEIKFCDRPLSITASTAGSAGRTFAIDADEHRSFIMNEGKQISVDELSRLILEPSLFNERWYPATRGIGLAIARALGVAAQMGGV
jgi:hypothetical protein